MKDFSCRMASLQLGTAQVPFSKEVGQITGSGYHSLKQLAYYEDNNHQKKLSARLGSGFCDIDMMYDDAMLSKVPDAGRHQIPSILCWD
jgi:hypothetical protein